MCASFACGAPAAVIVAAIKVERRVNGGYPPQVVMAALDGGARRHAALRPVVDLTVGVRPRVAVAAPAPPGCLALYGERHPANYRNHCGAASGGRSLSRLLLFKRVGCSFFNSAVPHVEASGAGASVGEKSSQSVVVSMAC